MNCGLSFKYLCFCITLGFKNELNPILVSGPQQGTVIMNVGRGTRESDAQKLSSILAQLFFLSACSEPPWKMCVCLYHMCAVCCSFMFILNREEAIKIFVSWSCINEEL